ncbi:hypothetical protein HMPREF9620_00685 [Cutibacterium acnes HL037PA1]|nr:hypothetical protein HMPREF9620_00685 [Cutibacterium acnes HL037PA1]
MQEGLPKPHPRFWNYEPFYYRNMVRYEDSQRCVPSMSNSVVSWPMVQD